MARCYERGLGVEQDLKKAVELYRIASDGGCEEVEEERKRLESTGE